jgi:hypothetical protein
MLELIGGRKVLVSFVVLVVGVGVTAFKGDLPPNFLLLLQVVVGAYVAGNSINAVAGAVGSRSVPAPVTYVAEEDSGLSPGDFAPIAPGLDPVDLSPILEALAEISKSQAAISDSIQLSQQGLAQILSIANRGSRPPQV